MRASFKTDAGKAIRVVGGSSEKLDEDSFARKMGEELSTGWHNCKSVQARLKPFNIVACAEVVVKVPWSRCFVSSTSLSGLWSKNGGVLICTWEDAVEALAQSLPVQSARVPRPLNRALAGSQPCQVAAARVIRKRCCIHLWTCQRYELDGHRKESLVGRP